MSIVDKPTSSFEDRIKTLESENEDLKKQLSKVEKERTVYLQNVSHQVVAPLNAMKWHIENLTEGRVVGLERIRKVLRSVYSQATLAVHLAKNFNLMSNLEEDHALSKLKEPLQEIELRRLLINLADDFQPLGWDQEINIEVDNSHFEDKPAVLAMRPLISQVFSNIIENAVKYSDRGTNIIITGQYLREIDSFKVSVRNHGISLSSEDIKRVFERGFRSSEAERKYPAGTGFGLYIARRIVEIHEGRIEVSSHDGWVTVEVTLTVKGLKGKARTRE